MGASISDTISPYMGLLGTCFGATVGLHHLCLPYLKLSSLRKDEEALKHIAADFALTPIRLALIYLAFPVLLQCVFPHMSWTAEHTSMVISGWFLLCAGYVFETLMTETSLMSLVHHGIALIFTAYCTYASQEPTGKHTILLRYTAYELFFAIGLGGIVTTANRLIYLSIPKTENNVSPLKRHAVSALTWTLVTVISCGWASKAAYLRHHSLQLYDNFGPLLSAVLLAANLLIFGIQYKWIFLWGAKADRLSRRCGKPRNINATLRKLPLRSLFGGLTLGLGDLGRIWFTLVLRV